MGTNAPRPSRMMRHYVYVQRLANAQIWSASRPWSVGKSRDVTPEPMASPRLRVHRESRIHSSPPLCQIDIRELRPNTPRKKRLLYVSHGL